MVQSPSQSYGFCPLAPTDARQRGSASLLTPYASLLPLRSGQWFSPPVSYAPIQLANYPTIQPANYPTAQGDKRTVPVSPNSSVPKAPISFEPPRVDRGVDPYRRAPARLRLTPHSLRLTSPASAPDKGSVPKALISFEPPRVDRGVDPYRRAPARLRLTPHSLRLTSPPSLRTMVRSPGRAVPLSPFLCYN